MAKKDNKREFKRGDFVETFSNGIYIFWRRLDKDNSLLLMRNGRLKYSIDLPIRRVSDREKSAFMLDLGREGFTWNSAKNIPEIISAKTVTYAPTINLVGKNVTMNLLGFPGRPTGKVVLEQGGYYYLENDLIVPKTDNIIIVDEDFKVNFGPGDIISKGNLSVTVRCIKNGFYYTDEGVCIPILEQTAWKRYGKFSVNDQVLIPAVISASHGRFYDISFTGELNKTLGMITVEKNLADSTLSRLESSSQKK